MNKKILLFAFLFSMFAARTFGINFAIGGLGSMGSSMEHITFATGISMGFYAGDVPLIWDILLGSSNRFDSYEIHPFIVKTRFDWHVVNWAVAKNVYVFFGPGMGFETATFIRDVNPPADYIMTITGIMALRIPMGFKIFPTKNVEVFLQLAPELGMQFNLNQHNLAGPDSGEMKPTMPSFYWAIDTSFGVRFWTMGV